MNPIICYVYEYKGIQKVHNSGFLKIQPKGRALLVQLHIKGLALTNSEMLQLCIFYKEEDHAIWEHIADLPVKNKSINMQLSFPDIFFDSQKHLQECDGFVFTGPYEECYVASWSSAPFSSEKLQKYEKPVLQKEPIVYNTVPAQDTPLPQNVTPMQNVAPAQHDTVSMDSDSSTIVSSQDHNSIRSIKTESTKSTENTDISSPLDMSPTCRKISRSEMSILPRRFWNLANNSFLLHGLHNYHHLLLVEMEDHFILGVPGLYDKKEARAADLFGFPIFSVDYISALDLNEEEHSDLDNFGYWCKTISKLR